ncbi:T9SS type A sorting domain-containing protein [Tenacibaculum sp. SZ-18]|uniref:T9SS type A sorting domain-containing protein n=1 Tax=Tenacibaculum sp. SZ-18 TaxID=754423 RepID=UPI0012FD7CCB|nr:T9SS type A sorting domain-containing protein [Tenacibaculum sp. SZ-18]
MKYHFIIITLFLAISNCFGQYEGPVPAITSGYGSFGTNGISVSYITNDNFLARDISVFYPKGITTAVPTIFFLHGWGGIYPSFSQETINNLVSNGYAVVHVPYKSFGVTNAERYTTLFDGFVKAAQNLPNIIDTSRVGFYGHSLGGGAVPRISYRLFTENNWGANGKFIYCDAPYYSFELGTSSLANFPTDCKMLTVLYDKDDINDLRMGMDVFNNISIDSNNKDCIIVYPDSVSGYVYEANHSEAAQYTTNSVYNAYDYYITFRLLNALADYTFTGNLTAKDIALGNGSAAQVSMGSQLNPLTVTDNPSPIYPESIYTNPCSDPINERTAFCSAILSLNEIDSQSENISIYPNPTENQLTIDIDEIQSEFTVSIFDMNGKLILESSNQKILDLNVIETGVYFIHVNINSNLSSYKLIKK